MKRAALNKASDVLLARPALWRNLHEPRLELASGPKKNLCSLRLEGFSDGTDQWNWYAEHAAIAGELARASKAAVFAVMCIDGAAYEEWVVAFASDGTRRWELREGDDGPNLPRLHRLKGKALIAALAKTPFGRLSDELGVSVKNWLQDGDQAPSQMLALVEAPVKVKRLPAGPNIRATVEVPASVVKKVKLLLPSWKAAASTIARFENRAQLLQHVLELPLIGERVRVELRLGANRWKEIEAEAARLNLDPGRLLTAALLLTR